MLDFTELSEEDGFDLEELFQTPVQSEENDGGLPPIDFGGEDAEIIPLAAPAEDAASPEIPKPEATPQKESPAPDAKPMKKSQAPKQAAKAAASAPQAVNGATTGEDTAERYASNMVDMFSAALQESDAADEQRAMQKLRDTPPLFSFAAIEEEITDPEMTFEALRLKMAEDLPELEDRGHVLWRVEYNGITEKIVKPAKETVFAVKRKIEDGKTFADKWKKRKPEDKPPVCVVKPTIEAQKKGVLRPYKGIYETLADARASKSAICYIPSGDGRLYELRRNEIGEFCTPANPICECEEIRAGFTLALPRIPARLMREIITFFRRLCSANEQEALVNLFWDREQAEYLLYVPRQVVTHTSVDADGDQPDEKRWLHVADIHSHNVMPAIFSKRDDRDERATRLYIVIGRLNCYFPEIRLRDDSRLNQTMEGYLSRLAPYMGQGEPANAAALGRLMNRVKMGYYPTDLHHVAKMQAALVWPEEVRVNLLDPCCGCGTALWSLAAGRNAATYGVELDRARAAQAMEKLDRAAIGSYYYSRISQNAFHVLFLNPPYLAAGGTRAEKRFLANSYLHLMQGGVLLYIIPYYRMDSELCRFLSEHFCDLRVYRFQEQAFRRFRQVLVIGRRKTALQDTQTARRLLALACAPEQIPTIDELPEKSYAIPRVTKTVSLFRGEEFNEQELAAELEKAGSILKRQSRLDGREQRPPLPLTISQIGLIGGSGLINGLIDCDAPHIIKGRVIKVRNVKKENLTDRQGRVIGENSTVTVSNQMVFNLLTPDGFRALA